MAKKLTHLQIFRTNFYNYVFNPHFSISVGESVDGFLMQTRLLFVRSASLSKSKWLIHHFNWHEAVWPDGVQNMELDPERHLVLNLFFKCVINEEEETIFSRSGNRLKLLFSGNQINTMSAQ